MSNARAQVVAEAGGWSAFVPGVPIAAGGATYEEAVTELVHALREYAEDWQQHLRHASNHQGNRVLVQVVSVSTDEQLRAWLVG